MVVRDLAIIAVLFVLALVAAYYIDLVDLFVGWSRRYETGLFQADEIFTAVMLAALGLAFFPLNKWRGLKHEITRRERAEESLRQLNVELEEQASELERRAAELDRANRALVQRNEENEMFVYSISHDLRSPLVNLQGFSRELQMANQDLHDFCHSSRCR